MLESKKELSLILVILAIGFSLRFCVSYVAPFSKEDYWHLEKVNEISLSWRNINLVHQAPLYHPPLTLYVTKLSIFLFGDSNIGFRILRILLSLSSLIVLYLLARSGYGKETAILALVLMSFDQYKIEQISNASLKVAFFKNTQNGKYHVIT